MWHPKFYKEIAMSYIKKIFGISKIDVRDVMAVFGQKKHKRFLHAHTKNELVKLVVNAGFEFKSITEVKRRSGYSNYLIVAKRPEHS